MRNARRRFFLAASLVVGCVALHGCSSEGSDPDGSPSPGSDGSTFDGSTFDGSTPGEGGACDSAGACTSQAQTLLADMQAYRQSNASDCGELTWDDGLAAMAYACARMMAEAGEGEACQGTSEDRARDAGVANEFATFAEATRTHAKLDVLVQGLETDRFNRFYLEECDYTKVGSGIAGNAEDGYWMVSTYGQPAD